MAFSLSGGNMGPMNDDDEDKDEMAMRPAAATPVKSDAPGNAADAADAGKGGGDLGAPGDEGLGFPGIEEAGYGYGV
jgi:hypothetical protein